MRVPLFLTGVAAHVRKRCARRAQKFASGRSWEEVVADESVDLAEIDGLIALDGPTGLLRGTHAFPFLLTDALRKADQSLGARALIGRAFEPALSEPWSTLALLGQWSQCLFFERGFVTPALVESAHRPLLVALAHHWRELVSVGPRYTLGSTAGRQLWELPLNFYAALLHCGASRTKVDAVHQTGEVPALIASVLERQLH